jgi:type III pantothenate kinase
VILDLDLGNTRIKWRLRDDTRKQAASEGACAFQSFLDDPQCVGASRPGRVRVSSVRGAEADRRLEECVWQSFGIRAEFARSSGAAGGLTNGYRSPEQLGVDRWLGMLAAFSQVRGAVLVIDFGSAVTADLVDESGSHRGGYIAPGLKLMTRSLLVGTDSVRFEASNESDVVLPGVDTASAVGGGVQFAVAGFANLAWHCACVICEDVDVVITGGDALHLQPLLHFQARACPALVLDGLDIALP